MLQRPPQRCYRQVAQTLVNEIGAGTYPIGELMPTEMDLCAQFGASRVTVREAIKHHRGDVLEMYPATYPADRYSYMQTFGRD